MPTPMEKWKSYKNRYQAWMAEGLINYEIKTYEEIIFYQARSLFYDNVPVILLLLDKNLVQEHCYERAKLMAYMLHDKHTEVVVAEIDSIKYNPIYIQKYLINQLDDNYSVHSYVRRKEGSNVWVYDTSRGLKIKENIYDKIEDPKILSVSSKPIDLNEIGIKKYFPEDLVANAEDIKMKISILREQLEPINEDYRELILKELEIIEKRLDSLTNSEEPIKKDKFKLFKKTTNNQ